tara:strand:- start:221 stop:448 length:228 start_codon:yes stop_codon:yes gene_type:complete
MIKKNVISPCISICKTDPTSGYCYGCGRTNDEKKMWKEKNTSNTWKENNLREARSRLSGWQLQTFLSSYESKKKN